MERLLLHTLITKSYLELKRSLILIGMTVGTVDNYLETKKYLKSLQILIFLSSMENFYIKLMINGILSKSFSAMNIPPSSLPEQPFIQEIIQYSREHYASLRQEVETNIAHWELLDFSPEL